MKTPFISNELVEFLEASYPERCPEVSWSEREIWIKAGERKLVRRLLQMHADQLHNTIKDK